MISARRYTFNTAIAAIMEFCNLLKAASSRARTEDRALCQEAWEGVVRLIAPVAPHIAESLWSALGRDGSVFDAGWPEVDEKALVRDEVTPGDPGQRKSAGTHRNGARQPQGKR